jgi:hypothetical protein
LPIGCPIGDSYANNPIIERIVDILKERQFQAGAMAIQEKKWCHAILPWKKVKCIHVLKEGD